MALSVVQAGSGLQLINDLGEVTAPLTLPTGVTLRADVPPRFFVFKRYVVLVNTPSQPLTIDAEGTVRLLSPRAPRFAPVLSAQAGGTLSGAFRAKYTFIVMDGLGNIISESDYSPIGGPVTPAAQALRAASLDLSPDQVSGRRLYRTTDQGAVYFQWVDLDGNILTSVQDDLADAGLSLFSAPILGTPPRLTTIAEFRGRLFGVGDIDLDHLRYTEAGVQYAWPEDNTIEIPAVGSDNFGVVALVPRREALGVGRRNSLIQITGSGVETFDSEGNFVNIDFDVVILSKELGIESQESVKVYRDTAYFLWKDGVYAWNSEGIKCISDGDQEGGKSVRSWFTSGDFFNPDMFVHAFAHIDGQIPKYRLFLAGAGSLVVNRWIEYNIQDGTWFGPHLTTLFTPTSAFNRQNDADKDTPMIGASSGVVYSEQETRTDGLTTAITLDVIGKRHDLSEPDREKYWGEISVIGKAQTAGTLTVQSIAGELNATREVVQQSDLTKPRQRLGRIGRGKHAQIEFVNAEVGVDVEVYGYTIDPVNIIGRR